MEKEEYMRETGPRCELKDKKSIRTRKRRNI